MVEIRYLARIFNLLLQRIVARIIIKKGFKTSIGWNLGKKNKSIHLFDPFTSTPIIGTNVKKIKQAKNNMIEILNRLSLLIDEKKIIKKIPMPI